MSEDELWKFVFTQETTSTTEAVNDLIRRAREIEYIRDKLIRAEQGGFSNLTRDEILAKAKATLDSDVEL